MSSSHSTNNERTGEVSPEVALNRKRALMGERRREFLPRAVANYLKTGNKVVDALYSIELRGIIIDRNWASAKEFQTERGQVILIDLLNFGNLVDWHRPQKDKDKNQAAKVVCWKKFPQPRFITTYARLGAAIGLNARQTEDSIERMVKGDEKRGIKPIVGKCQPTDEERAAWKRTHGGNEKPIVLWPIPDRLRKISGRPELALPGLKEDLDTGNDVVNALWTIAVRGNVIDFNWLVHPRLRTGTKQLLHVPAVFTLADIFFLHTPTTPFHPQTHAELPWHTKFDGDTLTKSYEVWSKSAKILTPDQLRSGTKFLHDKGIVMREVGTIILEAVQARSVPMAFITPNVPDIIDLTFGPIETISVIRRRSASEVAARKRENPSCNLSLFALDASPEEAVETASEIYGAPPEHNAGSEDEHESPGGIHGALPAESTGQSKRNSPAFIKTALAPLKEQQQQAESVVVDFDSIESGAEQTQTPSSLADDDASEIARRTQTVIRKLLSFATGCWKKKIVAAAQHRLEHAELWANHWPAQNEADPLWWESHPSGANPGIALGKRLDDESWLPPEVVKERRREEIRAENARKREEEQAAAALDTQRKNEDERARRKFVRGAFDRFIALGKGERDKSVAFVDMGAVEFIVDKWRGKNLTQIIEIGAEGGIENKEWEFIIASALDVAVDRALESDTAPVAEEIVEAADDDDELELPSLLEHIREGGATAIITELVCEVRDGAIALGDLDAHRPGNYTWDEWLATKERVQRAVGDVAVAIAPVQAPDAVITDEDAKAEAENAELDKHYNQMNPSSKGTLDKDAEAHLMTLPERARTSAMRVATRRALVKDYFADVGGAPELPQWIEEIEEQEDDSHLQSA